MRKAATSVAETPSGMEKIPSSVRYICSMTSDIEKESPFMMPGSDCPKYIYAPKRKAMIVRGRPTTRRVPSRSSTKRSMPHQNWAAVSGSTCWIRITMSS